MTISEKIEAAKTAILTISQIIPFATEHKDFIFATQESLFAKIVAREDMSDPCKEEEIDIATMGIYVMAITLYQARYKDESYLWHPDHASYYKSSYYPKSYDEVLKISGVNDAVTQFHNNPSDQNEYMVLGVGAKVMNGELPFNPETFKEILDKHKDTGLSDYVEIPDCLAIIESNLVALKTYMDETAIKITQNPRHYYNSFVLKEAVGTGYHAIEAIFHAALNLVADSDASPDKKKFMDGLNALKRETLTNFTANNFDISKIIADAALVLATKVSANQVTQEDVDRFRQETQKYKTSHAFAIALAVIIGAVIRMIAGAAIGFAVGSVPGAIIGGGAGLIVGGRIAGIASTMWYTKKEPLNEISSAATEIALNKH